MAKEKQEKLCIPESLSVLIPYKDLETLVNIAKEHEKDRKEMETLKKRVAALHGIYLQVLERLDEIHNSL